MGLTAKQRERRELSLRARKRVPKAFRQYAKRYANLDPVDVLMRHRKFPAKTLDHWRDRREKLRRSLGV